MPDERDLVDTNVLVYALYEEDDHHEASRSLLDRAQNDEAVLCVAAQIMAELHEVITDSRRVSR